MIEFFSGLRLRLWVVALMACCLGLLILPGLTSSSDAATGATQAPYSDPQVSGSIGLCNAAGQQITSGSVSATPFVARAGSSGSAPAPYNNAYRTAILAAYQPQKELAPGEWSGQEMTASSRYTNPAVPMVEATARDMSLAQFLVAFPANWDGFVQLRMFFGTANAEQRTQSYPALDIQVTGSTWHAVGGATVNCTAGSAQSIESILLPTSTTTTTTVAPATTTTKATTSAKEHSTTTTASAGGETRLHHSSRSWILPVVIVVAVVAAGVLAWLAIRRRRKRSNAP